MDPEVEDVMQEDVGQERADAGPLRRSSVRLVPFVALKDAGFEPLADKPQDSRIGDPVRHHSQQPLVVNQVEEAADVGIEHPVHAPAHDRGVHRRESLMRVPLRPKAIAEPEEIDFVDGAQHLGDRALDDLVFQRRYAERSLPAIGFGNIDAPHRLRAVASGLDARAEIGELFSQFLLVHRHRYPVDSRACLPLLSPERSFERRDIDMVEQGGEPRLGGFGGRRVHSRQGRRKGDPALRPDPSLLAQAPLGLVPSLGASRFLRRRHQYYEPVRTPDLSSEIDCGSASSSSPAGDQSGGPGRVSSVPTMAFQT